MNYFDKIEKKNITSLDDQVIKPEGKQQYQQLISNLKKKNQIVQNALYTAQQLILQYQKQNEELRQKNTFLTQHTFYLQRQLQQYRQILQNSYDQKQSQSQINQKFMTLTKQQQKSEEKIKKLSRQLQEYKNQKQNENKKKLQQKLGNYFCFASEKKSQNDLELQIKKLKWKLQQREQEVMLILKRSKIIQEKYLSLLNNQQKGKESQKFQTCSTQPTNIQRYNQ